jgi:hypothetical protein
MAGLFFYHPIHLKLPGEEVCSNEKAIQFPPVVGNHGFRLDGVRL